MAFVGISAIMAGTVTTVTVLAAVAEVGMIMTVVGAATGNEDLMKLGGVLGIVGGVGGMINGAMSGATGAAAEAGMGGAQKIGEGGFGQAAADSAVGAGVESGVTGAVAGETSMSAARSAIGEGGFSATMPSGAIAQTPMDPLLSTGQIAPAPALDMNPAQTAATSNREGIIGQVGTPSVTPQDVSVAGVTVNAPTTGGVQTPTVTAPGSQPLGKAGEASGFSGFWKSLDPRTQSTLIGTGASMFSGAQNQSNIDKKLALERDRVNQTSYGSAVPRFSIINGARG